MFKALKAKELIAILAEHPEADVWVERSGEHRRLERGDVCVSSEGYLYDADEGGEHEFDVPTVIFTSWD